jgi:hypothetical protein
VAGCCEHDREREFSGSHCGEYDMVFWNTAPYSLVNVSRVRFAKPSDDAVICKYIYI